MSSSQRQNEENDPFKESLQLNHQPTQTLAANEMQNSNSYADQVSPHTVVEERVTPPTERDEHQNGSDARSGDHQRQLPRRASPPTTEAGPATEPNSSTSPLLPQLGSLTEDFGVINRRLTRLFNRFTDNTEKADHLDEIRGIFVHGSTVGLARPKRRPVLEQNDVTVPNARPDRVNTGINATSRPPTFQAVQDYILKVVRLRKLAKSLIGCDERCSACELLKLTKEKFLVNDREQSRVNSQLFKEEYRSREESGQFALGSGSRPRRLGTLKSIWIKSSFCPFCRLIMYSLKDQPKTEWITVGELPSWISDSRKNEEPLMYRQAMIEASCFLTWQIDGREVITSDSTGKTQTINRTRRIRVHWDLPEHGDSHYEDDDLKHTRQLRKAYLVLMASAAPRPTDIFLGRMVAAGRSSRLELNNKDLINSWISLCSREHGKACQVVRTMDFKLMTRQAYFGVIDVAEMRLRRLPENEDFVALSYTWGTKKPFVSTLSNIRNSQSREASKNLTAIFKDLPETIQDAIKLTRELGEKYLWVDSICIVQDSAKSWQLNANHMDLVYGNAKFTICAADGKGSTAGLMNINSREFPQHVLAYKENLELMVSHTAESYIAGAYWSKRAWTFQERLLSTRNLIFSHTRVFFQCRSATMREDIHHRASEAQPGVVKVGWNLEHADAPSEILNNLKKKAIMLYIKSVPLYTERVLSRLDDILDAFQGIGNLMSKELKADLAFGLPRSHFDLCLLWEPDSRPQERLIDVAYVEWEVDKEGEKEMEKGPDETERKEGKGKEGKGKEKERQVEVDGEKQEPSEVDGEESFKSEPHKEKTKEVVKHRTERRFPTWSWCGWQGAVCKYKSTTTRGIMSNIHEWLMRHTWITWYIRDGHGSLRPVWDPQEHHVSIKLDSDEARFHGYAIPPESHDEKADSYGRSEQTLNRLTDGGPTEHTFGESIPEYPFGININSKDDLPDMKYDDLRFLQFWTWSARLRLVDYSKGRKSARSYTFKVGKGLRRYGISDYKGDWCGTIVLDDQLNTNDKDYFQKDHKFIAISEAKGFDPEEYEGWEYYIPKDRDQSEWDLYYVLMVKEIDEIAYRVGLGKVFKEAFENPHGDEKKWEEIVLG